MYFDIIGIPILGKFTELIKELYPQKEICDFLLQEFDFLKDKRLIFDAWDSTSTRLRDDLNVKEFSEEYQRITSHLMQANDLDLSEDATSRLCAMRLNNQYDEPDFISIPIVKKLSLFKNKNIKKADVVKLIIEKLPIPDTKTSWEKIFDFKSDPDAQGKLSTLRNWSNNALQSNKSVAELNDELETCLYQYSQSLNLHNIKYKMGLLETVVVSGAEIAENLTRLNFSKVASLFFRSRNEKIELLKSEIGSPGKEVAYIFSANQMFS